VIYASESYAGAMLELLVHRNAQTLPKHYKTVRILIPDEIKVESVYPCDLPGWDDEDERVSNLLNQCSHQKFPQRQNSVAPM
jgi:RES domain-containing protein